LKGFTEVVRSLLRGFKGLISLLTTIPVGYSSLQEAAYAFHLVPLVGLVEGLLIAIALYATLLLGVHGLIVGSLYLVAHVLLTGGIHLDGFADYSDVLGSRSSGSRAQAILKEPRRGSYAIIAMVLNMVLSLVSVHQLLSTPFFTTGLEGFLALVAVVSFVYVVSAESMFLTLSLAPPEPYEGMARMFSVEASRLNTRLANVAVYTLTLALLSPPILAAMGFGGLALTLASALLAQALSVLFTLRDSMGRLGFANGDVAGFSYELTRVSSLTVLAVVLGWYLRV